MRGEERRGEERVVGSGSVLLNLAVISSTRCIEYLVQDLSGMTRDA